MNLDKFYTDEKIAKKYIKNLNLNLYKSIIEPSAGNGSFSKNLPDFTIALDLEPEDNSIIKQDYFTFDYSNIEKKCLVIGNPPFGKRSKLAIDFFNYSAKYADTIAFVVPIQFRKWSVQNKLDKKFGLEMDEELEPDIFYYEKKRFSIRCCFQIWHNKNSFNFEDLRIKEKPAIAHPDFKMWQYNRTKEALKFFNKEEYKWDFAVPRQGFYDYKIREFNPDKLDKKIQWIFFKANDENILNNLISIDFEKLSKKNTTIPGFGKADVVKEYDELFLQNL